MMGSLQDQLIKAGLAKEEQARKQARRKSSGQSQPAKSPKRKATGSGSGRARKPNKQAANKDGEVSLAAAYAIRAKTEKTEQALSGKRKQMEDERRRKINLQLKTIILPASLNKTDAELERFIEYKGKIRKLYVTPEQQSALNTGEMGVVYLQGRHHVVQRAVAEQVSAIQSENVSLLINDAADEGP